MSTRWKIFAVLSLSYVIAYFYRVAMAVVAKDVAGELHLNAAELGALSGALFYAFALMQLPLGPLLDRFGGKKIIISLSFATMAGSCLFAMATTFPSALVARILIGAGTSCVLMGSYRIFVGCFSPREFVVVSGLIMAVGNLGNIAATAPLAIAASGFGWRGVFLLVALLQLIVTCLIFFFVQETPVEKEQELAEHGSMFAGWKTVFRNRDFWFLALIAFFWYGSYMVLQGLWGGPYLMDVMGVSRDAAGSLLLFTAIGYVVGATVVGKISNDLFLSRKRTLLAGQIALLLLMSALLGPLEGQPAWLMRLFFFSVGLAVSSGVMIYPLAKETFSAGISATAMTAVNFFVLAGAAVVQQIMGVVIESFPGADGRYPPEAYHAAFLFPLIGLFFSVVFLMFSRQQQN